MEEKRYYVLYWYWKLLYTVRDDGGNTSIFNLKEADDIVKNFVNNDNNMKFAMKVEIPENWKG